VSPGDRIDLRDVDQLGRALDRFGPWIERAYAPRAEGLEHLEREGPALLVGNHSGGPLAMIEPLVLAYAASRRVARERLPHLLLHEIMWRTPLAPWLASIGAVRATAETANGLLASGRSVLVYPGGDREAFRTFRERDTISFGARRGYVKLAIERGVPIVPVVTTGMHSGFMCLDDGHALATRLPLARSLRVGVLPVTLSFPFGLGIGVPPPYVPAFANVRIRVLPPMHFLRKGAAAANDEAYVESCHRLVSAAMQRELDALSGERRGERRTRAHAALDRFFDELERLTLLPRAPAAAPRPSTVPAAPSPPLRRAA
jgi:1-acyl-sn-glycerol-3-phosphate acyltransferase